MGGQGLGGVVGQRERNAHVLPGVELLAATLTGSESVLRRTSERF